MSIPGFHPRAFVAGSSIGRGRTRAADIRKIRNTLDELGYLSSPPKARLAYTPAIADGIEQAQRDFELKPDGIIDPDGPTEQTLNLALIAKRAGGGDAVASVRDDIIRHNRRGLRLMRDSVNPGAFGVWRDKNGKRVKELKTLASVENHRPTDLLYSKQPNEEDRKSLTVPVQASKRVQTEDRPPHPHRVGSQSAETKTEQPAAKKKPEVGSANHHRLKELQAKIDGWQGGGLNDAARMLSHYIDNTGKDVAFTREEARAHPQIRHLENKARNHFLTREFVGRSGGKEPDAEAKAYNEKLLGLKDGESLTATKENNAVVGTFGHAKNIATDQNFALAFGRTPFKLEIEFHATRKGNQIVFEGTALNTWKDTYDFERFQEGSGLTRPLEHAGFAKQFGFGASWKQHVTGTVDVKAGTLSNPRFQWTDLDGTE